jgi:adenosylhomocysteine nucleosidase
MDTPAPRIAVVCAVKTEVRPLVKSWPVREREHDGRKFKFFESERMVVVCAGMGAEFSRRATEAIIQLYRPELVISTGFAGAMTRDLKVGAIIMPRRVIDITDGSRFDLADGEGVLISFDAVAHKEQKMNLAKAYGAIAVDMEAAAAARGAEARGIPFKAVKSISDELDFQLPPLNRFIGRDGQFAYLRLAAFAAMRPWLWCSFIALGLNSWKASQALCRSLAS